MTPDEARKLVGGYASSSLTEAERTALFQAALEDQELFDELAGEQVLKEVLDEPGARRRLIASLEPSRQRAWLWAAAAAMATMAIVVGVVVSQRTPPPPQQIAQVLKSPAPLVAPATQPAPTPPPPPKRKVSPSAPVPAPVAALAPPPPAELQKDEAVADQAQQAKPQPATAGAFRRFASEPPPIVFGFNYSVSPDGFLEITPSVSGYLSVTASDAVVFGSTLVGVSTLRIAIPSGATSMVIAFSRTQAVSGTPVRRDEASGTVTDQDPPNARILIQLFLTRAIQ